MTIVLISKLKKQSKVGLFEFEANLVYTEFKASKGKRKVLKIVNKILHCIFKDYHYKNPIVALSNLSLLTISGESNFRFSSEVHLD